MSSFKLGSNGRTDERRLALLELLSEPKTLIPVHDDQALLQCGHHIPGQIASLLLAHMRHTPVNATTEDGKQN